jgi:hypothetical protein
MSAARFSIVLAVTLVGCVSETQVRDAINDVNTDFRLQYEGVLAEKGSRAYRVSKTRAYEAMIVALQRLGMRVGDQAGDLGYVSVFAPAPMPLATEEWNRAAENDLPKLRQIASRHVGIIAQFINFEPEGLEIVINGTVIEADGLADVSLTMRMREYAPPKSGRPRREYPPPTAVRMGLDKIWTEIDRELPGARVR